MSIHEIQTAFISEATSAQALFADLAKVELYIAESYRSRAFIELLQNADDAGAHRFLIRQIGEQLIVANDGSPFTSEDVIALCRSGASNKRRGSGTIGYRGIGFKSVAGIAHEIDVISRNFAFRFSKELTQLQLNIKSDVPLIRVPHPISFSETRSAEIAETLLTEGMNTVFIFFGLDERMVADEAETFDKSAMLFLNNVSQVEIELPSVRRQLNRITTQVSDGLSVEEIGNRNNQHRWLVAGSDSRCERIAFALEGDTIVPAAPEQSVIHAFMPTTEFAGAQLKMNGDFSTDPSRKSVNLDDSSIGAFDNCVEHLARLLQQAVATNSLPGIFSPFLLTVPVEGRFRKMLRETLLKKLDRDNFQIAGSRAKPIEIRLRPEWLSYADYEQLCRNIAHVPQVMLTQHPQLPDFLKWLGAHPLSIEEALAQTHHTRLSPMGCAQILCRAARQYRYDLTEERVEILSSASLFPVASDNVSARVYIDEPLLPQFLDFIKQQPETDDIRYLSRRLKLQDGLLFASEPCPQAAQNVTQSLERQLHDDESRLLDARPSLFRTPPAIKAWRSAEQNTLAWLSALADVLSVKDVSQANVGYDLEVVKRNGEHLYVEVKSVSLFGDPIRMTNNENATAYQLGQKYLLAFVVNSSDQFNIRFIRDPVRTLALEKRCEQWSWYSDNYLDYLTSLTEE